jgi:hypothetical protein
MQKRDVIFSRLVPADQNASEAVHPTMRPLDHPPAGFESSCALNRLSFLAPCANMSGETKLLQYLAHFIVVITFIQTHALRLLRGWLWALHRVAFDRLSHHFHIIPIGSVHGQPNWDPAGVRQQTSFNAGLSAVGRVLAGFFPRPMALWSSRHPYLAKSSLSHAVHHSVPARSAKTPRTRLLRPILENGDGRLNRNRSRSYQAPSTGNLYAGHRTYRWRIYGREPAGDRRQSDAYSHTEAVKAPVRPITRPRFQNRPLWDWSVSLAACVVQWMFSTFSSSRESTRNGVFRIGSKEIRA